MFTHKDIEMRTIFVVNCIQHDRSLRVNSGELMLEEIEGDKKKTITKFPFQNIIRKTKRFAIPERAVYFLKTKRTAGGTPPPQNIFDRLTPVFT